MKSLYFKEEHNLFRDSVRKFLQKEVIPYINTWEEERRIPKEIFKKMGEQGYLGLNFPTEYGGVGADFWYSVVFLEEISKVGAGGFPTAVSVHQYMAINHIFRAGSDFLKEKYLVPAIAGEKVAALGISEPGAGSDVASIRTKAVKDGDYYIINGAKTFITNGTYGDFITLAVSTNPENKAGGISLIVVDLDSEGITRTKLKKMGWHSSDTAEISFDNVRVPKENLVGVENFGFYYIMESFQLERLVAGIMAVASSKWILEETIKYMHEREAFGKKIAKYQTLRHTIADLATELYAAEQMVYHTCWLQSQGEMAVKECSMVKLYCSELANKVVDRCLQIFGGYGYMEDYMICRAYRDARVGTIAGGTSEIMREIIAKMTIDDVEYKPVYS
ncbi:MAG: acyl-CoA dehydrogenase family protein [Raineya sp.]|nr:acyl-CoA dehydrogenase family protein [Raineya sp.]MDW8295438.1 acyl-CoA dehydrogenase family protein [Raineya sp.]